ncbi:MAG: hypothetical protein ACRCX2_35960 [Paraclostridium sp.]
MFNLNKESRIKMDTFFSLQKQEYVYLKLIPNTSVRNFKTNEIAMIINREYKDIITRFKRESKGFSYELPKKISFIVDMTSTEVDFYMLVSKAFSKELTNKLTEVFGKITIEEVSGIKDIDASCTQYSLECAKDDSLSLKVDRKNNDLLNSNLSAMNILEQDDRLTIVYNFVPQSKFSLNTWSNYHADMLKKYNDGVSLDRTWTLNKLFCVIYKVTFGTIDSLISVIHDSFGKKTIKKDDRFSRMIPVQELSYTTKKKEQAIIVDTQIAIYSQSNNKNREEQNARALINTYNTIAGDEVSGDNKLIAKKIKKATNTKKIAIENKETEVKNDEMAMDSQEKKKKIIKIKKKVVKPAKKTEKEVIDLEKYEFNNMRKNKMSCEELSNFIALPGKELIEEYDLEAITHNETIIPEELQGGNVRYGTNSYRGTETEVTTSTNTDAACMPVVMMGKMGSGKSSLFENNGVDSVKNGEGLIMIDFIKNCETSDNIIRNIDKDKAIVIDFADFMCQEGFGFNEIEMMRDMDNPMSRYSCAGEQANEIFNFIDNLGKEEFSAGMSRFLDAACTAVLIHENKSLKDVVKCLECYKTRAYYVELLEEFKLTMPEMYQELIQEDLNSLDELNEHDKSGKKITGTKTSKIDGILSRIYLLRRNPSLKFMYARSTEKNINLVELMQQGKAIFFKLPQSNFSSPMVKNVMVSYLMSKVMLASVVRAKVYQGQELRVVNLICDELQQAPGSFPNVEAMSFQMRKFRVRLTFSCHGFHTIAPIKNTLIDAGATIMLLKGSSTKNFEVMEDEFTKFGFTKEDLVSLSHTPKYKALCLIATKSGRYGAMVELPPVVKNKIELNYQDNIEEVA